MKRLAPIVLLAAMLSQNFGCAVFAGESQSDDADEALVLNLAANWKLANQRKAGNEQVLQYLPSGSNLHNPAELLTVTTISNVPSGRDAKTYILQVKQAMESAKGAGAFNWRMVKETPLDASCEYTLSGHGKIPDQHEIMRVIRGAGELHSVIYHFGKKTVSTPEKERAWEIINAVKLAPVTEP